MGNPILDSGARNYLMGHDFSACKVHACLTALPAFPKHAQGHELQKLLFSSQFKSAWHESLILLCPRGKDTVVHPALSCSKAALSLPFLSLSEALIMPFT